jgi:hypothetical protein
MILGTYLRRDLQKAETWAFKKPECQQQKRSAQVQEVEPGVVHEKIGWRKKDDTL